MPTNPPTMSMEEYMAAHHEEFTPATSSSSSGHKTQKEESEKESDEQVYKQRAWDDWKDSHPRGCGNRLGNKG